MNQKKIVHLHSERLLLRKLLPQDWEMISYLRSDKDVNKFVKRPNADTKEKALAFIEKIARGLEDQTFYYWAITKKGSDKMIGSICLWNFSEDRLTAELGYDLCPEYHKQGIMNESLEMVLAFGFQNLQLTQIDAFTQKNNTNSCKLLTRNGFVLNESRNDDTNPENGIFELLGFSYADPKI
jgi:ribosomal-protein-alanine N-acetyltransferase